MGDWDGEAGASHSNPSGGGSMKTLIVPDVHEDISTLMRIESRWMGDVDRVVMLGDFFDTFGSSNVHEICEWILRHINDERFTWLFGNHDCHYVFDHPRFGCSGFKLHKRIIIHSMTMLRDGVWRKFKMWTEVPGVDGVPIVVSHAGFHPDTLQYKAPNIQEEALALAFSGEFHPLWNAGAARGGRGRSGVTWLDWEQEFTPISGMPQIVGHTKGRKVRTKEESYCIDTALNHVAIVEDGVVSIHATA